MKVMSLNSDHVLEVHDLRVSFAVEGGRFLAVDGVSWSVPRGKTVALVGESGCGKSVSALTIMRLLSEPPARIEAGSIRFRPEPQAEPLELTRLSEREMQSVRGRRIGMVFQEPMSALNPVYTIGEQLAETIALHQGVRGRAARDAAIEALREVEVPSPEQRVKQYPHELSGGMRQRVMIAMALCGRPALLLADEPTTALDVTIQASILDLLRQAQVKLGLSIVLITHDLGVVAQTADCVYVMYAGTVVEHAPTPELFANPLHPYTQGLLKCVPRMGGVRTRLEAIPGQVPNPRRPVAGCPFHPRCCLSVERAERGAAPSIRADSAFGERVLSRCVEIHPDEPSGRPVLRQQGSEHFVACWEA